MAIFNKWFREWCKQMRLYDRGLLVSVIILIGLYGLILGCHVFLEYQGRELMMIHDPSLVRVGDSAFQVLNVSLWLFLAGIVIIVPLLAIRSRKPVQIRPTPLGGAIVASSFIFSILIATLTMAFPDPYEIPSIIRYVLTILVPYVAAPATLIGVALIVMFFKYLARRYDDVRISNCAVAGFACIFICMFSLSIAIYEASYLGTSFFGNERRVTPLAPIMLPLVMNLHGSMYLDELTALIGYVLFSTIAILTFILSTVFLYRSIALVSPKTNAGKLKIVRLLLLSGSGLALVFSMGISLLIPLWFSGTVPLNVIQLLDYMFATCVLAGIGILSIAWVYLSKIFSTVQVSQYGAP